MDPFITQIIAWAGALGVSIYAGFKFNGAIQEQRRLPEATKWKNLKELIDQRQTQLNDKQAELAELKDRLEVAQKTIADSLVAEAKINDAKQRYESLQAELLKLEADRKEQEAVRALVVLAKQELEALEAAKKVLDAQIIELNKEIGNLTGQKAALESELSEKRKELEALKAEYAAKSAEYKGVVEELARQKGEEEQKLRDAKSATDRAIKDKTEAEKALVEVLAKLAAAEKANEDAEKKLKDLLRQQKDAEAEIKRLEEKRKELERKLDELRGEVSTATLTAASGSGPAANRYEDLWKTAQFQDIKLTGASITEEDALKKAKKYIEDCGLTFPDRVINAFHASLKTADMSPLVVLAGISGTGKSELPMRYAEGMGIHLVSLAVQPRWDSPNDLFGFYNHLEGRYKATELARAMVQFEIHNRETWPMPEGWEAKNAKSKGMLLVLLDEMNLARVEYYFSEFLSKLETRRGVNVANKDDRAKAEIALDMGSLQLNEAAIKLYPDRNVLFAGTMNEDESTQSLSDKVLDRACVMRFGRPRDLTLQQQVARVRPPANLVGLTFSQWKEWCDSKLDREELEKLEKWIKRLNDVMEKLNRPFGHRVGQAIARYAANYPKDSKTTSEQRLKLAMADQIEQRILPKLRGIDLEEQGPHITEIRNLIEELEDKALAAAFEASKSKESNTFIWRGVDRAN
jgi:predicted  nucleic acid-binding Zn-ribbon protein